MPNEYKYLMIFVLHETGLTGSVFLLTMQMTQKWYQLNFGRLEFIGLGLSSKSADTCTGFKNKPLTCLQAVIRRAHVLYECCTLKCQNVKMQEKGEGLPNESVRDAFRLP